MNVRMYECMYVCRCIMYVMHVMYVLYVGMYVLTLLLVALITPNIRRVEMV